LAQPEVGSPPPDPGIPEIQDDPGCDTCADPVSPPAPATCCTCGNGICEFHEWWFGTCDDNQPGVWIGVQNCPTYCPADCDQPGVPGTGGDLVCTPGETCEQDSVCAGTACSFDWCGDD
jgi:hypothetical protein